jgi:hypothetical protein
MRHDDGVPLVTLWLRGVHVISKLECQSGIGQRDDLQFLEHPQDRVMLPAERFGATAAVHTALTAPTSLLDPVGGWGVDLTEEFDPG